MKRFLSWIVLFLCCAAFYICEYLIWILVKLIYSFLYGISPVLFWVCIVVGGLTLVYLAIIGLAFLGQLAISLSEKVYPSVKGSRYKAFGIINIVLWGLSLIIYIAVILGNHEVIGDRIINLLVYVTMLIFGICLVVKAKGIAAEGQSNTRVIINEPSTTSPDWISRKTENKVLNSEKKYCRKCGAQLSMDDQYCNKCGTKT